MSNVLEQNLETYTPMPMNMYWERWGNMFMIENYVQNYRVIPKRHGYSLK